MQQEASTQQDQTFWAPNFNNLLFSTSIEVQSHSIKKNGKTIRYRWGKGNSYSKGGRRFTPFIGSTDRQKGAEAFLVSHLRTRARDVSLSKPLNDPLWCMFKFQFPADEFYTLKKKMCLTIGDQSNLYQMPEDALQRAKIIRTDALIRAHCLSTCLPSDRYKLEIYLFPYEDSPAWWFRNLSVQKSLND